MSRRNRPRGRPQAARRIRVVGVRRTEIDRRRLSRALLDLAAMEAERAARADHQARTGGQPRTASGSCAHPPEADDAAV
jgi:hypothetical protein